MKFTFFVRPLLGALVMLSVVSCNKLNEVYEDLDQNGYGDYQRTGMTLTLSDQDYESATSTQGAPAYVGTGGYFLSTEEAETYIPGILNTNYTQYGNGSQATIVYNLVVDDSIAVVSEYTVTDQDYDAVGLNYGNFETEAQVISFLTDRYPMVNSANARQNALVLLTYEWYNGDQRTINNAFYHSPGGWISTYLVNQDDYAATDNGGYSNFDGDDDANLEHFFNNFLKDTLTINPAVGDIHYVTYLYYSGSTDYWVKPMQYDGLNWVFAQENGGAYYTTSTLNFVKNGDIWEINAATLYTFSSEDYLWIANNESFGDATSRGNLGSYLNFYVSNIYWSQEEIDLAIAAILAMRFPDAAADDIYEVMYDIYLGSVTTTSSRYVADGAGNFVREVASE